MDGDDGQRNGGRLSSYAIGARHDGRRSTLDTSGPRSLSAVVLLQLFLQYRQQLSISRAMCSRLEAMIGQAVEVQSAIMAALRLLSAGRSGPRHNGALPSDTPPSGTALLPLSAVAARLQGRIVHSEESCAAAGRSSILPMSQDSPSSPEEAGSGTGLAAVTCGQPGVRTPATLPLPAGVHPASEPSPLDQHPQAQPRQPQLPRRNVAPSPPAPLPLDVGAAALDAAAPRRLQAVMQRRQPASGAGGYEHSSAWAPPQAQAVHLGGATGSGMSGLSGCALGSESSIGDGVVPLQPSSPTLSPPLATDGGAMAAAASPVVMAAQPLVAQLPAAAMFTALAPASAASVTGAAGQQYWQLQPSRLYDGFLGGEARWLQSTACQPLLHSPPSRQESQQQWPSPFVTRPDFGDGAMSPGVAGGRDGKRAIACAAGTGPVSTERMEVAARAAPQPKRQRSLPVGSAPPEFGQGLPGIHGHHGHLATGTCARQQPQEPAVEAQGDAERHAITVSWSDTTPCSARDPRVALRSPWLQSAVPAAPPCAAACQPGCCSPPAMGVGSPAAAPVEEPAAAASVVAVAAADDADIMDWWQPDLAEDIAMAQEQASQLQQRQGLCAHPGGLSAEPHQGLLPQGPAAAAGAFSAQAGWDAILAGTRAPGLPAIQLQAAVDTPAGALAQVW